MTDGEAECEEFDCAGLVLGHREALSHNSIDGKELSETWKSQSWLGEGELGWGFLGSAMRPGLWDSQTLEHLGTARSRRRVENSVRDPLVEVSF